MAKKRIIISLECSKCGSRNYHFARGKKKEYKLQLKKFCRNCHSSTLHKEVK